MSKIVWPSNPKEGDQFSYVDPIGGASWVFFEFRGGAWVHTATR